MWRRVFADKAPGPGHRHVAEEIAVALVYDGSTHAVLMATPADLEDLAIGFSLTEGIVADRSEIVSLDVVPHRDGIELRSWLTVDPARALAERRRRIVGPSGCGLCGVESLEAATAAPGLVEGDLLLTPAEIRGAVAALPDRQPLGSLTRAVHAAGWWSRADGLMLVREDVGRHNAVDKLAGALARGGLPRGGLVVLTSRVSVEMVQKSVRLGAVAIAAVSAPTALAIRAAEQAGATLIGVARDDGFEVFAGAQRIVDRFG